MDQIEVNGLRIAYERVGVGPPVMLAHGFVGDALSTWSSQLDELSDEFTVVAWDAPGAGRSTVPPETFRMSDYAECLAAFVRALSLKRPHVVGLSFGGALALEVYRRHPDLPRSLVLAGAYAGWTGSLTPDIVDQRVRLSVRLAGSRPDEFASAMVPSMFSPNVPGPVVARFAKNVREFNPGGFLTMMRSLAEADLREVLPAITVPTLLLYGDRDLRAPLDVAEALHAAIRESTLVVLKGVGHVSSVEAPAVFNREMRDFLRSASRQP